MILEKLDCTIEKIEGTIAFIAIKTPDHHVFYGEYPTEFLKSQGVLEHRRFNCIAAEVDSQIRVSFEPVIDT